MQQLAQIVTLIAGEDLRNAAPALLKIEDDGGTGKVVKTTARSDHAIGVLSENPTPDVSTDGLGVSVALLTGIIPMRVSNPIAAGAMVGPSVGLPGAITVVDAGNAPIGITLKSVGANEICDVLAQS